MSLSETVRNPSGVSASQNTGNLHVGVQWNKLERSRRLTLYGSYGERDESYAVFSPAAQTPGYHVNLNGREEVGRLGIRSTFLWENTELDLGTSVEQSWKKSIQLDHLNWNFLPPDYNTDNPSLFQKDLNNVFGSYNNDRSGRNMDAYSSLTRKFNFVQLSAGVRFQHFDYLFDPNQMLYRLRVKCNLKRMGNLEFFFGSFARSPVNRILEPNQVLIDANLSRLSPIKSNMYSARYSLGPLTLGLYRKTENDLPLTKPAITGITASGIPLIGYGGMESSGKSSITGGEMNFEYDRFFSGRLDFSAYYSASVGRKTNLVTTVPHELDTPHTFFIHGTYELTRRFSLGGEFSIRSGYPYSPPFGSLERPISSFPEVAGYVIEVESAENSKRFATYMSVNLQSSLRLGSATLYFSIANLLNRKNPIIQTADGFVYDAGILPGVGLSLQL
jgi:hypothetical protein